MDLPTASDAPRPPVIQEAELPRRITAPEAPLEAIPEPEALAHARPADAGVFRLGARRAVLHLAGTGGVVSLAGDGIPLLEQLRVGAGANLLAGPRSYRRETVVGGVPFMEAGVVPELLPGALLQWWRSAPAGPDSIRLDAVLPLDGPPDGPIRVHRDGGILWVARGGDGVLLQALPPRGGAPIAAADLEAHPRGTRLVWTLPVADDAPLSLLVQSAPPEGPWTHLRPLALVGAHHRRGEDAAAGKDEPGIVVTTGVDDLDRGTALARTFVRHSLLAVPGGEPVLHGPALNPLAPARMARAAAAAGEWEVGRAALATLSREDPRQRLAACVAVASWLLWTGEKEPLRAAEDEIVALFRDREALASLDDAEQEAARRMIRSAAEAAELKTLTDLLEKPVRRAGGGVALPMAGGGTTPAAVRPVDALFAFGRGQATPAERLTEAARWREGVGHIVDDPSSLDADTASQALLGLVEGLLGVRSDAAFGRMSVSPLLPANWTRFRVEGLRSGEGTVEVAFSREGDEMRWEIAPRIGSVPVTLIFEPWFPCPGVTDVRMDGQPAELESDARDGWCRVQVQVPADGHRTLSARAVPRTGQSS